MKDSELPHVRARLMKLIGQPLARIGYAADMLTMTFGNGEPAFHLHIQCSYRLATAERILFDRIDYFVPSDALTERWRGEGLEEDNFPRDWCDEDCCLFERVKRLNARLEGMRVVEAQVNQLGDLTLCFAAGETLLALPMGSDDHECWRLWNDAIWPDQHMVIYGDHAELNGPGERCSGICGEIVDN